MKKPTLDLNGVSTFDFHEILTKLLLLLEVIQCSEKAIDGEVTIKSFDKIPFLDYVASCMDTCLIKTFCE